MNDKQVMCELNVWISVHGIIDMNFFDVADSFDCFHVHKNHTNTVIVQCKRCLIEWIAS